MNIWSCRKNGWIRKVRLISILMTSQSGSQTIAIDVLPNISRSKDNQAMKIGQLKEHNKRNIFFKNCTENEAGRLLSDLFFFIKKFNMR